jgi:signal transduction histidine kinase
MTTRLSPTASIGSAPRSHDAWTHGVQLSAASLFPAANVAAFLCEGLHAGEAALTLAAAPHGAGILAACRERGIDTAAAQDRGTLVALPAESSLAALLHAGRPDAALFEETIARVVERMTAGGRRVRAYGEMVDLLWSRGERDHALALEELWNDLLARVPLRLLCGYTLEAFEGDGDVAAFRRMCARHESVSPVAEFKSGVASDPGRLVAELQVQSTHVQAETRQRHRAEQAERAAREQLKGTHEQLARLQTVTSALAEAVTLDDVGRLADSEIMRAVGATQVVLAVAEGEQRLRLLAHNGAPADPLNYAHLAVDERSPVPETHRTGIPVWIDSRSELQRRYPDFTPPATAALACLPIRVAGRRVGVLAFGFASERHFSPIERSFMQDLARQVGFALERGRLYEEARRSEARLREANQRKDEFLALLGHELRNPLAPIMTALQVMKLRGDTSSERERAMIERQVRHVRRLVDDLLDVSRITQGKLELQKTPVDVNNVIAQAIEWAGPLIEQRFHRLKVDMPRDSLWIEADAGRLAQAVGNLLTNAAKYTDRGGTITMRVHREAGEIVIAVRDTGAGIAPEMLSRIFERFVQVDRTVERSQGGLGLGLALVKSLVTLHGGAVSCTSDGPGCGSEFRIRLPAIALAAPLVPEQLPSHVHRDPASLRRVLIVDDNPDAADALADMLEALGHETQVAYDGVEAIEKARGREFDVAILDLNLPVMDGYEVARGLRALDAGRTMRFIAVTGFGTEDDHARSREAGFADHLVKPIDYDRLLSVLEAPRS